MEEKINNKQTNNKTIKNVEDSKSCLKQLVAK